MRPEFSLIDAETGKPAAAYRTTLAVDIYDNVNVQDMDQRRAADWLAMLIDQNFTIAGSNAQCMRLENHHGNTEAEIWGIGAIHFPKRIWETRAEAEDAAG